MKNKIAYFVSLLITIIGLVSNYSGFFDLDSGVKKFLGISLFIVLGILLIIMLINKYGIFSIIRTGEAIRILGINRIVIGNRNEKLQEKIRNSNEIRIITVSGDNLIKVLKNDIHEALTKKKALIKIIVATKNSEFLEDIENIESPYRKGAITTEIENIERYIKEYQEEAQKVVENPGKIELRFFRTHLRASIILCDNWGWYTFNLPPKRALHCPSIELINKDEGLYEMCSEHFNGVWNYNELRHTTKNIGHLADSAKFENEYN